MSIAFVFILFCIYLLHSLSDAYETSFQHQINYEHDGGEKLILRSKGKFAKVIDIDDITTIKVCYILY